MSNFFEHIKDGISQLERQLEALMPEYVKVDERSPHELLQLLTNLSAQFNYYNFQNQIDGNWEEFFHRDLVVMLITTGAMDFTAYETSFLRIRQDMHNTENDDELFNHTQALFLLLYDIGIVLMDTLHKLQQADKIARVWNYLEQVMDSLEEDMLRLHRFEYQVIRLFPRQVALHEHRVRPLEMTHTLRQLYTKAFDNPGEGTEVFEGFYSLNGIYDSVRTKFYQVTSAAANYLKTQLLDMQHSPHMGLLLTFIELYKHLQQQINKVPKRHLDFYYRQVLGIQGLKAVPDRVPVFLEPAPQIRTFTIEKGQVLLAATNARKEPLHYQLLDNVKVHDVKIMSLHTLFVSDYLQIASPSLQYKDIKEAQVYLALPPVIPAADYEKESTVIHPWPLLGEDQHDLSPSQRTMEDTAIGFMIGSPVLYLQEGNRHVQVTLYFEPATFSGFIDYVKNFAQVSNRDEAVVLSQLLSGAFQLYFTSEEGWEPVARFSVKSSMAAPLENSIDISFALDVTAKAWNSYDDKVHGGSLSAAVPLLKVLLNNTSFHHPYSFLRYLLLERVGINIKVKRQKYFKLHNNIGALSAANAFPPFGPQPAVGAYLDVKNSNIFNRFTRDFGIKLEWENLPRDETGFDAYYAAYGADLRNTDFKVGISSLNNGRYLPERGNQQLLDLFKTTRDREGNIYLSDVTILKDVDLAKLSFPNDMLLEGELQPNVSRYKEGAVRIELAAPSVAFGHSLFSQVFPEVAMYNAQWHLLPKKKKPLPNQPYVPMIKSMSVNYMLEHMEALKSVQADKQGDGLEVYHAMPSGYRKIYPVANSSAFSLLPVAEDMGSLCIGFDKLYPDEELSLFFQLEEKHYSDTVYSVTPLKWSYLNNNSWLPFERTQLLSDDTNNLVKSGIIKIRIPPGICNGNTMLDPALFWISISAETVTGLHPKVVGVFTNAVMAERQIDDNGQTLNETLSIAPFAIKKFKTDIKTVQHVWQLFPSYGGRQQESEAQYYTRVSERLRHKQRPVLGIDIAQALLQEFPELLIVKSLCVKANGQPHLPEQADVSIIVVPRQSASGRFTTLEPKVDLATLYRIQSFVQRTISPFIKAEIRNPVYEKVKVVCKVKFNGNNSQHDNVYLQQLHDDIKRYLCPWLFATEANLKIGSALYRSELLNFINQLPYVNYVTGFSLVHFFYEKNALTGQVTARATDTALDDVPFIRASVPEGVLIPSEEHLITALAVRAYEDPHGLGIDSLQVSGELIVGKDLEMHLLAKQAADDPLDEEILTISIQPK